MRRYSIKPRIRKYIKLYRYLSFARKYKKQLMDAGLDYLKTASKKLAHKACELLGNKTADVVTKPNDDKTDENPKNVA